MATDSPPPSHQGLRFRHTLGFGFLRRFSSQLPPQSEKPLQGYLGSAASLSLVLGDQGCKGGLQKKLKGLYGCSRLELRALLLVYRPYSSGSRKPPNWRDFAFLRARRVSRTARRCPLPRTGPVATPPPPAVYTPQD